jgi:hypothetical protein
VSAVKRQTNDKYLTISTIPLATQAGIIRLF